VLRKLKIKFFSPVDLPQQLKFFIRSLLAFVAQKGKKINRQK